MKKRRIFDFFSWNAFLMKGKFDFRGLFLRKEFPVHWSDSSQIISKTRKFERAGFWLVKRLWKNLGTDLMLIKEDRKRLKKETRGDGAAMPPKSGRQKNGREI